MGSLRTRKQSTQHVLVFAPIAVLSLVFCLLAALLFGVGEAAPRISPFFIIFSALIYLAAAGALVYFGMSRVENLQMLSMTDSLSLLPNRRALHSDVRQLAEEGEEIALALIDLDGFKSVNDHYGHGVGDQLIKDCGAIIAEVCGEEGHCYRLGGDEFAVAIIGPIAGNILEGICRRLIERMREPLHIEDRRIVIGASVGLSRSDGKDGLTSSELLRRSDVAMYASKNGGKMRCTWFSEDFDKNRENVREIDAELRHSLGSDEFVVHYQPLVDAHTRAIVAVEALLRWEPLSGRKIGPSVFIPIAEETGLINAIGLWVLRRACDDAADWGDIKLAVNISAAQLGNPEFPIQLGTILEETGFPPERLELEVTETCLVLDPLVAERCINVIRGFGVNVALDDFGTGYASIGFLRQFRFEKLKLDRSLVVNAADDEGSRAMMLSSITVARTLEMAVTAEGVETEAQADLVRTAGCDHIQGWLYHKAMPCEEVTGLIAAQARAKPKASRHKQDKTRAA